MSVLSSILSSRIVILLTINDSGWAPCHNYKIYWVGGKGWIKGIYGQRLFSFCEFRFFIHKQRTTPNSYRFSEQVKCILRMRENVFTIYSLPPWGMSLAVGRVWNGNIPGKAFEECPVVNVHFDPPTPGGWDPVTHLKATAGTHSWQDSCLFSIIS